MDANRANMVLSIVVCCALHNICETKCEYFWTEWAQDLVIKALTGSWDPTHLYTTPGSQQPREICDAIFLHIMKHLREVLEGASHNFLSMFSKPVQTARKSCYT